MAPEKKKRGPKPERLKIDLDHEKGETWEDVARALTGKGKPPNEDAEEE